MTIHALAAFHRPSLIGGVQGVGEPMLWLHTLADPVQIMGAFAESPNDVHQANGMGIETEFSRATLTVSAADVPGITRADGFVRVATGQEWTIDQLELTPGVGWHITLSRAAEATLRDLRS